MTAFCDAFLSSSGGWQAALIAALQLPTNGMPGLNFRTPVRTTDVQTKSPRIEAKTIAISEYAQVEIDFEGFKTPSSSYTSTRARNSD